MPYFRQKLFCAYILAFTAFISFLFYSGFLASAFLPMALALGLCTFYCYHPTLPKNSTHPAGYALAVAAITLCAYNIYAVPAYTVTVVVEIFVVLIIVNIYFNGNRFLPLRQLVWGKLTALTIVWTMSCVVIPMTLMQLHMNRELVSEVIAFSLMVLVLSIPFEKRDAISDSAGSIYNLYNHYGEKKFARIFHLSLLLSTGIILMAYLFNIAHWDLPVLVIICSASAFILYHSKAIKSYNLFFLFDILFHLYVGLHILLSLRPI